jgi:phage terminase large subunit
MNTPTNRAAFPVELRCLFHASRYKVLYGGRGSAKSWSVARALLMRGIQKRLRILCTREFQNSLADSVHRLLADQVELLQLSAFYTVGKSAILGANGTEFRFAGIRHNISKIKSFEGFDIVWIEEGQTVSKNSFDVLIPTIRKAGSEIWLTFNPELEEDDAWQRFVVGPARADSIIRQVNWRDNPWFTDELRAEKDHLLPSPWLRISPTGNWMRTCGKAAAKARDPDGALEKASASIPPDAREKKTRDRTKSELWQ